MFPYLLIGLLASWEPDDPPPDAPPPPGMFRQHGMRPQPGWLDSALEGRTRKPWSGLVELERPDGRRDTARVCGGPSGFRLDFRDGKAHWTHGDTTASLNSASRTIRLATGRAQHRPPPGPPPVLFGTDIVLGHKTLVFSQRGPRGGAHRMWVDTSMPLLLRGEGPGPGARRVLSIDLSHGCPADAFVLPQGWKVEQPPRRPPMPHEEASLASLEQEVGFRLPRPLWLPAGFEPAGQSWMEGRRRRIAHLRWSDGARIVSLFVAKGSSGFKDCDDERPCQRGGPDPVMVRHLADISVLVTAPLPPEVIKRISDGLR